MKSRRILFKFQKVMFFGKKKRRKEKINKINWMFKMFVTCIVFRIYKYSVIRSNQIAIRITYFHPRVENLKNTKAFFKKRFPKISNLNDFSAFFLN